MKGNATTLNKKWTGKDVEKLLETIRKLQAPDAETISGNFPMHPNHQKKVRMLSYMSERNEGHYSKKTNSGY
tara:strand:- start:77 stop:292 length:216 start_codon:yes stop_codon:yes gene_type:complete